MQDAPYAICQKHIPLCKPYKRRSYFLVSIINHLHLQPLITTTIVKYLSFRNFNKRHVEKQIELPQAEIKNIEEGSGIDGNRLKLASSQAK
nr:hypothetical protein [Tanacetum cinerariifolium]